MICVTALAFAVATPIARAGTVEVRGDAVVVSSDSDRSGSVSVEESAGRIAFTSTGERFDPVAPCTRDSFGLTCPAEGVVRVQIAPGPGDDRVYTSITRRVEFFGGDGDDQVNVEVHEEEERYGLGFDLLDGGPGDDLLNGEEGADVVLGGPGDDVLRGGPATDTLDGGTGEDELYGDDFEDRPLGRDVVRARDGRGDHILCLGADVVMADLFVDGSPPFLGNLSGCGRIRRADSSPPADARVTYAGGRRVRLTGTRSNPGHFIALRCAAAVPCVGQVGEGEAYPHDPSRRTDPALASAFEIAPGARARVWNPMHGNIAGFIRQDRGKRPRLRNFATTHDETGRSRTTRFSYTVLAARSGPWSRRR